MDVVILVFIEKVFFYIWNVSFSSAIGLFNVKEIYMGSTVSKIFPYTHPIIFVSKNKLTILFFRLSVS